MLSKFLTVFIMGASAYLFVRDMRNGFYVWSALWACFFILEVIGIVQGIKNKRDSQGE